MLLVLPLCYLYLVRAQDPTEESVTSSLEPYQVSNETIEEYKRCPFEGDDPCECTIRNHSYTIACKFMEEDVLPRMMQQTRDANLSVLTLFFHRGTTTLPRSELFRGLPFTSVHFSESQVQPPADQSSATYLAILGGLEPFVREVYFRDTSVPGLDSVSCALGALQELRRLSLTGAGLTKIPDGFFCCSYYNLEDVYLYNNNIQVLPRGALSRTERLRIFNANNNSISVIDRQFFPDPASTLQEIHLRHNKIQTLPRDLFSNMSALSMVDLSYNQISLLPANTWSAFWATLPDVYLDNNNLSCECDLDWLSFFEQGLGNKSRFSRFLTGHCTSPNNVNDTAVLDNLDPADVAPCTAPT